MNKTIYRQYIERAVHTGRASYDTQIAAWRAAYDPERFLGTYTAPGNIALQAKLEGFMYQVTKDMSYAEQAKRALLDACGYTSIVTSEEKARHPEYANGVPVVEPMFQGQHYIGGYLDVKDSGVFAPEEKLQVEAAIRSCINALFHYPEWGAHNRSMLRVWTLSLAIEALGVNEETDRWNKLRHSLAEGSIGQWSIEDAQLYLPLWLASCLEYARSASREDAYFALPQTRYYFDYMTRLITPYGQIPDFGDAHFNSFWYLWLACLEKGAAVYHSGQMKYAAEQIWRFAMAQEGEEASPYLAAYFTYAYAWSDDRIQPVRPDSGSEELLEDLIGKKIAMRSGWEESAVYLLLNYRDEGDYAKIPRTYLQHTISAAAEKTHHGHSDENAISLLVKDQCILLHDGGYREQAPNGKYRNDIYHNRLVFRDGRKGKSESAYHFLHDSGAYKKAVTEKLHFQTFEQLDYSRTRLYEPARQMTWERHITYLKSDDVFIIVDWARSEVTQTVSTANLWHTGEVLERGEAYLDTCVTHIHRGPGDLHPYRNKDNLALLIEFPGSTRSIGSETIKRCYGQGEMIYEWDERLFSEGSSSVFVTVLTPHERQQSPADLTGRVTVIPDQDGRGNRLSLEYRNGGKTISFAYKLNLESGLLEDAVYPRYSWADGKRSYEKITTDADFAFVSDNEGDDKVCYGLLNGSGLMYGNRTLFQAPPMSVYVFETGTWKQSDHKWRMWEDKA
ncbi:hypothetical protein EBB07_33970 [Paenibacillaceae bacterium]|nr:hypothetical protein EBB07_33970 [Paenibacillaceae bacterium]